MSANSSNPVSTCQNPETIDAPKRLSFFELYLSIWVALCMGIGIVLGKQLPELTDSLRKLEFGQDSHINLPIAVLIWLMITR